MVSQNLYFDGGKFTGSQCAGIKPVWESRRGGKSSGRGKVVGASGKVVGAGSGRGQPKILDARG